MKLTSLHDLYLIELRDLYSAEHQIVKTLPRLARAATAAELRAAFEEHFEQTQQHVERLEWIFEKMDLNPKGKRCKAIEGMLDVGKEILHLHAEPSVLDAALISAAQKVEHYEMAGYGCVRTFASLLGDEESAQLLQQTLGEESETDKHLTMIAESMVNLEAIYASGG